MATRQSLDGHELNWNAATAGQYRLNAQSTSPSEDILKSELLVRGAVSGVIASLRASFVMNAFQDALKE